MNRKKILPVKPNAGSMLQQKTNQDYNNKPPDSNDPNEGKGKPKPESSDNGYDADETDGSK